MSNSEEYLDGLLRESISGKKRETESEAPAEELVSAAAAADEMPAGEPVSAGEQPEEPVLSAEESGASEDEFLQAFEEELLSGEDTDAFIRQFEQELAADEDAESVKQPAGDEVFFENLDGILGGAGKEEPDDDMMVDTIGDMPALAGGPTEEAPDLELDIPDVGLNDIPDAGLDIPEDVPDGIPDIGFDLPAEAAEPAEAISEEEFDIPDVDLNLPEETDAMGGFMVSEENQMDDEDADVQLDDDLMNLLQSEGEFSDLDGTGDMDDLMSVEPEFGGAVPDGGDIDDIGLDMMMDDGLAGLTGESDAEPTGEETPKEKKPGFLKRFSMLLFGPDEEEAGAAKVQSAPVMPTNIEDLTDDNLALLQALEGGGQELDDIPEKSEIDEKARKKQEKKEKKEQKKKERAAKREQKKQEKANRPKKEKKPKKPKEPDNTPPLPKAPVILCFVMAGSLLALVVIGTNLFGYSNSVAEAQKSYDLGDYESAFARLSGMEIKEADIEIYEKSRILAYASGEFRAYQSFFAHDYYDLALDSLVRAIGRCEKYAADAEQFGCASQLAAVRTQAVGALSGFGVSEEQALALYANDDREAYSVEIYQILTAAGFDTGQDGE